MPLSMGLILIGLCLPLMFFDEDGQDYAAKGIWSAARRHWSGIVGLLLILAGISLIVANLVMAQDTLRPLDWMFLLMPLGSLTEIIGPRVRFPIGAPAAILVAAAILFGGNAFYGARLQWAYAQLNFLMLGFFAIIAAIGFGVLKLMDWMIERSERSDR